MFEAECGLSTSLDPDIAAWSSGVRFELGYRSQWKRSRLERSGWRANQMLGGELVTRVSSPLLGWTSDHSPPLHFGPVEVD
jgi:hypothetical protein